MNLRRRHLDESQRDMAAARLATLKPGRPEENSQIHPITQERANTIPRLHRAKTVAWGLVNWGSGCGLWWAIQ
jgi:hypothetical protein